MKLSPHAVFCLSQAIHNLREAADFTEQPVSDEVEVLKEWHSAE